jgi:microcystin degradation protein MlrC
MRIVVGGIQHETNTFSPLPTRLADFQVLRGQALLRELGLPAEPGVELVATVDAHAWPGGLVERAAYEALKAELLDGLRAALPVDGVYLALHGAMEVEGVDKAEADLLRAVREVAGPGVPVTVSLDLHANVTPSMVELTDGFTAYRTAPHTDERETRRRAYALLLRCLREGLRPASALVKPPLVLSGEEAITAAEPMASLLRLCEEIERLPGMLSACLLVGCAWTDVPHVTTSVIATSAGDPELAASQARRLAEALWERRGDFRFDVETGSIDECIERALASVERPAFITDAGDNPTAGAPGDVPLFADRLLAHGVTDAVCASIPDPVAVAACREVGVGGILSLRIGGVLDPVTAPPLAVTGEVRHLWDDPTSGEGLAVLRVAGVDIALTTHRRTFTAPEHFIHAGIDPLTRQIIVVKQGYLFAELAAIAPRALMALSPGYTDLVLERLPYRRLVRPVYPFDRDMSWRP